MKYQNLKTYCRSWPSKKSQILDRWYQQNDRCFGKYSSSNFNLWNFLTKITKNVWKCLTLLMASEVAHSSACPNQRNATGKTTSISIVLVRWIWPIFFFSITIYLHTINSMNRKPQKSSDRTTPPPKKKNLLLCEEAFFFLFCDSVYG